MPDASPDQMANFAARETALKDRETQLQAQADAVAVREQALQAAEDTARRQEAVSFVSGLVRDGRVLPLDQPALVTLLMTAPAEPHADFAAPAESGAPQPRASTLWLRDFLGRLPKQVEYREFSGRDQAAPDRDAQAEAAIEAAARRMAGLPPKDQNK